MGKNLRCHSTYRLRQAPTAVLHWDLCIVLSQLEWVVHPIVYAFGELVEDNFIHHLGMTCWVRTCRAKQCLIM